MNYDVIKNEYKDNKEVLGLLNILSQGQSVVCIGKAGCGKSTLIDKIRVNIKNVVVTAPTGIAALNINGQTLHSFFELEARPYYLDDSGIKAFKEDNNVIRKCELIIIDEISMVRVDLLTAINQKLQLTMQNSKPFGGKQVLLIGDVFQLPPVVTKYEKKFIDSEYTSPYFFSTHEVQQIPLIQLQKNYRQNNADFIELLDRIRFNRVGENEINVINALHNNKNNGIVLCATNKNVFEINNQKYNKLKGKAKNYRASMSGIYLEDDVVKPNDINLELKVGTRVMTIVNDKEEGKYCNGSMGVVNKIKKESVEVKLDNGNIINVIEHDFNEIKYSFDNKINAVTTKIIGTFSQLPIKKAWAITIHKSQGLTFDEVSINMGRGAFCTGQTYVALSRCKSFKGIDLINKINRKDIFTDTRVANYIKNKTR